MENEQINNEKTEDLLSGTTGGHVEPEKPKEETAKEYAQRVLKNNL
jgi:hypothetical protein